MTGWRSKTSLVLGSAVAIGCAAGLAATRGPKGNRSVPEPEKPVDLERYLGLWYELGRYENRFERGCEAVTAEYRKRPDGLIEVINSCRQGGPDGRISRAKGRAKVVEGSNNAKLKVAFFGPFFGDYWVLDHDDSYRWAIIGEPSGRYLWLLNRARAPTGGIAQMQARRAAELGYDTSLIRWTQQ